MIQDAIARLVQYGLATELIEKDDAIWAANHLLEILCIDVLDEKTEKAILNFDPSDKRIVDELPQILNEFCNYGVTIRRLEEDSVTYRDLFDTQIMGALTDRPSNVIRKFRTLYAEDPRKATDWYYKFSQDTDYIRRYRAKKDLRWKVATEYGDIDITINLAKPEKDPKAIAAAGKAKSSNYPKCLLCAQNEGYAGTLTHPARENHRIIPITINDTKWGLQYSPYGYYNEHCIAFNFEHTPMAINHAAFCKLFDFVRQFPHYFLGSNADLPIVGGSILSHDHFQGGHYTFAMEKAPVEKKISFAGYEDIDAGIVKWPMSVIRLTGEDPEHIVDLSDKILTAWRGYTDKEAFIYAETDGEKHNTITPIARMRGKCYEIDLVLRNNITTPEYPLGVYHPHEELHHIKKENIGLIEVMGCAILPARLKKEMADLKEAVLSGKDYRADGELVKHADWMDGIRAKYSDLNAGNLDGILQKEIGIVFSKVLECAGVYKRSPEGQEAFLRFVESVR